MLAHMDEGRNGSGDEDRARDVALVIDRTEDRGGYRILRRRHPDSEVELGTIRPLEEGRPISGEVVSLRPRQDVPFAFDVKTELEASPSSAHRRFTEDGPAQIATDEYRRGWDAIWGTTSAEKPN
jgi:hypothetical protein